MRAPEASGGTPLAATETVALPFSSESIRLIRRRGDAISNRVFTAFLQLSDISTFEMWHSFLKIKLPTPPSHGAFYGAVWLFVRPT